MGLLSTAVGDHAGIAGDVRFAFESGCVCVLWRSAVECSTECAIGLVVKYFVANEVPRVRFPDGAFLLSWRSWQRVGLIIPRSPVRPRSKAHFCGQYNAFVAEWSKALDSSSSPSCGRGFESHRKHHFYLTSAVTAIPKNAFDRGRTGDLGIMRPTRCQLRHES